MINNNYHNDNDNKSLKTRKHFDLNIDNLNINIRY